MNRIKKNIFLQKNYNNNKFSPNIDLSLVELSSENEEIGENYNKSKQRFINKKHVKKIIYKKRTYKDSNNNDNKYFDDNKNYIPMIISEKDKQSPTKDDKPIFPVLNMQNAVPGCLQEEKVQEERKQQNPAQQMQLKESKLNESKIAYEMYGTRTANYDFKSIFLSEAKITRFSTISSSEQNEDVNLVIPSNFRNPNAISRVNLSKSSSSSSCSCSSCLTLSDTDITSTSCY